MQIAATVTNQAGKHSARVRTENNEQVLAIPAKQSGPGSSVSGGELLFLALATCFCNDLYREAKERAIEVLSVQVEVTGRFGAKGASAEDIQYRVSVKANADRAEVLKLIQHTDSVAEIHNTVRKGTSVRLSECIVEEVPSEQPVRIDAQTQPSAPHPHRPHLQAPSPQSDRPPS